MITSVEMNQFPCMNCGRVFKRSSMSQQVICSNQCSRYNKPMEKKRWDELNEALRNEKERPEKDIVNVTTTIRPSKKRNSFAASAAELKTQTLIEENQGNTMKQTEMQKTLEEKNGLETTRSSNYNPSETGTTETKSEFVNRFLRPVERMTPQSDSQGYGMVLEREGSHLLSSMRDLSERNMELLNSLANKRAKGEDDVRTMSTDDFYNYNNISEKQIELLKTRVAAIKVLGDL